MTRFPATRVLIVCEAIYKLEGLGIKSTMTNIKGSIKDIPRFEITKLVKYLVETSMVIKNIVPHKRTVYKLRPISRSLVGQFYLVKKALIKIIGDEVYA
jgi:hypothetical protein